MRIQHNIPAMNAYRNYNANTKALQGNLQKLSSGYKINKAGDDAAGLAISEKMRAQITGLEVAQKNAKDGISLVQTAEGALQEVHTMLNRMYSLAEQSANGTYADEVDREQLQKEVVSLQDEINRIADASNFNGKKLLDGSLAAGKAVSKAGIGATAEAALSGEQAHKIEMTISSTTGLATSTEYTATITIVDKDGNTQKVSGDFTTAGATTADDLAGFVKDVLNADNNIKNQYNITAAASVITIEDKTKGASQLHIAGLEIVKKSDGTKLDQITYQDKVTTAGKDNFISLALTGVDTTKAAGTIGNIISIDGQKFEIATRGNKVADGNKGIYVDKAGQIATADKDTIAQVIAQLKDYGIEAQASATAGNIEIKSAGKGSGGLTLQIGDTSDTYNKMTVSVDDMHAAAMGIGSIDIGTEDGASAAMTSIKNAINYVSNTRGTLGSLQNRLDHTINNLSVQQENIQDAEATIRDVDVANEMMAYTKNNILVQSAQAMLAQANQLPQGVLQLLG